MSTTNEKRFFQWTLVNLFALTLCAFSAAQVTTAPPPNRSIAAPGPQAHTPPARQQQLPGSAAPQPIMQPTDAGTIEGFVYWDTSTFTHTPASSCAGLSLTVSVANGLSGPFKGGFTPLPMVTNNFKYVGQVKSFLSGGKVVTYDVCTYGYNHLPVGPQLKVEIGPSGVRAFSPIPAPQPSMLGPITIINGQCNMLPHITNPTLSDLTAHWGSCQNMAYNVNFVLQDSKIMQIQSANGGGASPTPQTGMLASKSQQGMLTSNSAMLPENHQSTPGQVAGVQSPGSKVELNPQPFPPRATPRRHPGSSRSGARPAPAPPSRRPPPAPSHGRIVGPA